MPKKKVKNKAPSKRYAKYKVESGKVARAESCPRCEPGTFLAIHKNRKTCGKCSYTIFSKGGV